MTAPQTRLAQARQIFDTLASHTRKLRHLWDAYESETDPAKRAEAHAWLVECAKTGTSGQGLQVAAVNLEIATREVSERKVG